HLGSYEQSSVSTTFPLAHQTFGRAGKGQEMPALLADGMPGIKSHAVAGPASHSPTATQACGISNRENFICFSVLPIKPADFRGLARALCRRPGRVPFKGLFRNVD